MATARPASAGARRCLLPRIPALVRGGGACRGSAPSEAGWETYLSDVAAGLAAADRWVAPTAAFRDTVEQLYAPPRPGDVIFNGIEIGGEPAAKQPFILAAGRIWDEAKNIGALTAIAPRLDWPVRIAGATRLGSNAADAEDGVEWLGEIGQSELLATMRKAGIFVVAGGL